jgi:phage shock protein A
MRQVEARRAIGDVLSTAGSLNLHGEFDRISARIEEDAATERNYQRIDDELSGEDLRRRFEKDAVADAVEERLARLREPAAPTGETR